ncbi:hypothetical protein N1031_14095 [Herbiconiux moechotypicola]|uniref:Uncharacterized protein n=1 Tax=Herbiconiux moechotypicola TaxID=637393 RepID=A0ABP5QTY7_9MICO|nr:hypothetical protein [Herbiconiux moechotypicola]MCS5730893.1 hypothetical protein [Herbiconiux moechotypicola]
MTLWRSRRNGSAARGAQGAMELGLVPVLGAGRHRSPKSGACFMEYASFLAGERWSDHPACTHAGLAHLARAVNDLTSDQGRPRLAPLVPSVIGLTSDDERLDLVLAVHAAALALPDAPLDRQHALAVGALVCRDALVAGTGDDRIGALAAEVVSDVDAALDATPEARDWAVRFLDRSARWQRVEVSLRQTQATLAMAVDGVRSACRDYPDARLAELLSSSIELARRFVAAEQPVVVRGQMPARVPELAPDLAEARV